MMIQESTINDRRPNQLPSCPHHLSLSHKAGERHEVLGGGGEGEGDIRLSAHISRLARLEQNCAVNLDHLLALHQTKQ